MTRCEFTQVGFQLDHQRFLLLFHRLNLSLRPPAQPRLRTPAKPRDMMKGQGKVSDHYASRKKNDVTLGKTRASGAKRSHEEALGAGPSRNATSPASGTASWQSESLSHESYATVLRHTACR